MDVALVTGANSGIGRAAALKLANSGYKVYAGMRRPESGTKLHELAEASRLAVNDVKLDVTDEVSVLAAVRTILEAEGAIDVLVNNAGIVENGTVEESTVASFRTVFDVNVYGMIRCVSAVLPSMRHRGQGAIVNIGSVAGRVAMVAQAPYVASKWALEGLTEELAHEIAPFGIRVALIEPGVTKTSVFSSATGRPPTTGAYESQYRRMFQFYSAGIPNASPAAEVAEVIHAALTTDQPKLRYVCSWGGPELADGRHTISDEDWVSMGGHESDRDYYKAFQHAFGLSIGPKELDETAPQ